MVGALGQVELDKNLTLKFRTRPHPCKHGGGGSKDCASAAVPHFQCWGQEQTEKGLTWLKLGVQGVAHGRASLLLLVDVGYLHARKAILCWSGKTINKDGNVRCAIIPRMMCYHQRNQRATIVPCVVLIYAHRVATQRKNRFGNQWNWRRI